MPITVYVKTPRGWERWNGWVMPGDDIRFFDGDGECFVLEVDQVSHPFRPENVLPVEPEQNRAFLDLSPEGGS